MKKEHCDLPDHWISSWASVVDGKCSNRKERKFLPIFENLWDAKNKSDNAVYAEII